MKKLVTAACALAAGIAMADGVTSANTVGYSTVSAGENLNWYAPHFLSVGESSIDINTIQLDDGGAGAVGWGDSMQIVGPLGNATVLYAYWDKSMGGDGQHNFWGDENATPVDITLDPGAGFAIDNMNGLVFDIKIACPYTL